MLTRTGWADLSPSYRASWFEYQKDRYFCPQNFRVFGKENPHALLTGKCHKRMGRTLMNNFITKREANCDSHGSYTSQRRAHRPGIWSSCPTCIRLEIEQDKRDDRVSLTSIRREARINSIGIPPRYMTASLDESPYADQVRKWLADGVGSLFLVGPVGNGKTTLACAICIFAAWNGKIARYMSVSSFMQKIRDVWKNNSGTEAEIIAPLVKCDLLVIDDVGATRGLDSETFRLHELILTESIMQSGNQVDWRIPCACMTSGPTKSSFRAKIGVDGHYGECDLWVCPRCDQRWLHYFIENESHSRSTRAHVGFLGNGPIPEPIEALPKLNTLRPLFIWQWQEGRWLAYDGAARAGL